MNPVKGYTMINFLQWVAINHPEIKRLRDLAENELINLVDEFEGGNLKANEKLINKWLHGFKYFLFNGNSEWEGYDKARASLLSFEKDRGQ
jgi:hypothetical protein